MVCDKIHNERQIYKCTARYIAESKYKYTTKHIAIARGEYKYSDRVVLEPVGFLESSGHQAATTPYFTWILKW
jgi:hypothetical protein